MEGGGEKVKVEADVYDKEVEQSTTKDDEGHVGRVDFKGVPREEISTSNKKEDTSARVVGNVVNSSVRVYHKRGQSQKHAIWSLKDLDASMILKMEL